jgi:hypothetical protein
MATMLIAQAIANEPGRTYYNNGGIQKISTKDVLHYAKKQMKVLMNNNCEL